MTAGCSPGPIGSIDRSLAPGPKPLPVGHAELEVELVAGQSSATHAAATSPLKVLTPQARGQSVWAYLSSFGGGLVAGDRTHLNVRVGEGARCLVSTQASTKVFKNPTGLPCGHGTRGVVEEDGLLVFAPEPVQAFALSHYEQRQEWRFAPGAGLVLLDWFCSGRPARGERWAFARFQSRNDVYRGGQRVFVDSLLLDGGDEGLSQPLRTGRFNCFAMVLLLGQRVKDLAAHVLSTVAAQPIKKRGPFVLSASPVGDGAVVRIAGEEVEDVARAIHRQLEPLADLLGDDPWKRKW
jgi:urease accessory protein